jgi:site-specific DNA-cytosine methylase
VVDGIPDWLDRALKSRTKRLSRLGNSVVPDCVEWLGRKLLEIAR